MSIFNFKSYKKFCNDWVLQQPKAGRGQFRKMALHLNVNPVIITQVLKGDRNFNEEQAYELTQFLGLSSVETDYFLLLMKYEKAGTYKLQKYYLEKIKVSQKNANEIKNRLPKDKLLSAEAKATFYSNWYYSGIRLLTAIPEYQSEESIANYFGMPLTKVREVVNFLVENNLCFRKKNKIICSDQSTHIDAKSPLVSRHHKNWREQSAVNMLKENDNNMFFTAPIVIDQETADYIKQELLSCIERLSKKSTKAPSEQLMCLNIDWFHI